MVSRAGDDSVRCGEDFEFTEQFGKRGLILNDKVSGEGNEVRRFLFKRSDDFGEEFVIGSWSVVKVSHLSDLKSVESLGPAGQGDFAMGGRELVGLDRSSPNAAGYAGGKESD